MRDLVLSQISSEASLQENRNRMRRFLQIILLKILHESSVGSALAFTGGTALHFIHELPRFSEDLDFSLVRPEKYDLEKLINHTESNLGRLALDADLKTRADKPVHHINVRFPN